MNIPEIAKQVRPYLIKLAESPPVQAEIKAVEAEIISIIKSQSIPIGMRIIRWIIKKVKGVFKKMATTTITVQNSEGTVLEGATISYTVSGTSVEGTTDSAGLLAIEGLEAGTYTFTATKDGYTSASTDVTVTTDADETGVITMTAIAESTEGESSVSDASIADAVKEAAEDAAKESLSDSLTSGGSNLITLLTNLIDERIAMWEADSERTDKDFVKFRNKTYIIEWKAIKALVKTGGAVGIALAIQKLSK